MIAMDRGLGGAGESPTGGLCRVGLCPVIGRVLLLVIVGVGIGMVCFYLAVWMMVGGLGLTQWCQMVGRIAVVCGCGAIGQLVLRWLLRVVVGYICRWHIEWRIAACWVISENGIGRIWMRLVYFCSGVLLPSSFAGYAG